ncbi:MAG: ankyrin repeat domain-containing protein [Rickettsiales bacterium]|jgi:ankyrin repeat protein|nr:ankyrin repeat domain-containing protein [Rickettsiales bacterium]
MHINQNEGRKHSQVSYPKTRSVSVDSGFGDEEVINKTGDDIHAALRAIKKGKRKFEKWREEWQKGSADISSIKNKGENNILHLIALLKKKQKRRSLKVLMERISEEDLAKLVDSKNKEEKTPLQVALIDKIKKGKHESNTTRGSDNTLKFLVKLLKHRASYDNLELSTEELQNLEKEQKTYYRDFLEKLAESVRQSTLEQKIDIEKKIKEIIARIINTPDSSGNYLLHSAINNYDKKRFKELLEKGAAVSLKDANDNNALHLIAKLEKEQKLEFLNVVLDVSQEKELLKEQFIKAVNDKNDNDKSGDGKNSNGQTPLHQLLQHIGEKSEDRLCTDRKFEKTNRYKALELLLQNGANITAQDKEGNNALHYIASFKEEQKVTCLKLTLGKDEFSKAINAVNGKEQTPLHQLLQHIKGKNEDRSCKDKKFEKTNRYKALKLLLQNGADITAQDKEGNALHHIALLKGEQKGVCLDLIVKEGNMPEISKAVNAKNGKKQTPLQVVLIAKVTKDKHKFFNPKSRDNTIKFCVKLLQNGTDPKQLILPESLWSREYYKTIKGIEKSMGKLLIPDDMRTELKLNFGKKFKARDIMKYVNNVVCKVVITLVFVAVTCAVVFSAAQGSITIATALSIIAAIGVCYLIYLNLENTYEGFKKLKGKFTEEKQPTHASKNDTQCNDSSQNMENKPKSTDDHQAAKVPESAAQQNLDNEHKNSEKQKAQELQDQSKNTDSSPSTGNARNWEIQKSSDQSKHTESPPNSDMSAVSSVVNFIGNCVATNKPSSLGR